MKVKPVGECILVEIIVEEMSKGGIILSAKKKVDRSVGTVVGLGPLAVVLKSDVEGDVLKIGDKVLFPKYSGMLVDGDEETISQRIIYESDVKAIIIES